MRGALAGQAMFGRLPRDEVFIFPAGDRRAAPCGSGREAGSAPAHRP
jgi:hypothetical protein